MGVDKTAAVKAFQIIRDQPYKVDVSDEMYGCNCYTKAIELQPILEKLNYETRIMICHFDWRDSPFPQDMLSLYDHNQETTHAYLEARTSSEDEWHEIDPSWDKPLAKLGFEIAEWDGSSATVMSVTPTKYLNFEEGQMYLQRVSEDAQEDVRYRKANKAFFDAMNIWMNKART